MDARIRKGTTIRLPSFVSVQKCRIMYCSLEIALDKRSISFKLEVWFQRRTNYCLFFICVCYSLQRARQLSRYSDWLRAERSGDRIPVGARFSAPVQTGTGAHPTSCTLRTGSFLGQRWPRRDTDPPSPSSTVVKKEQSYTSTPTMGRRP